MPACCSTSNAASGACRKIMSANSSKKGRELEKAVGLIQDAILRSDPKLAGASFTIELNKIINVSGVHHEIDVFVKTLPDSPYESTWIFECKNWKDPVSKNEVLILAGKVNAISANRGFLVARRFTKDAEAQVSQDARLNLIPCTDDFLNPVEARLIYTTHDLWPITISIKQRDIPASATPLELDWEKIVCRMNGESIDFRSYIGKEIDQLILEDQRENHARYVFESTHSGYRGLKIEFGKMELVINDIDVESIQIPVHFWVTVHIRKIISKFELKDQGRFYSFEPIDEFMPGKRLEINMVQRI